MILELRFFVVRCITCGNNVWNNVWKLCFIFVRHCNVFSSGHNCVICLFGVVTFFDDVRNRFYFVRSNYVCKQLRFVFIRHCNIFLLRHNYVVCLFDVITFFDGVRITLYFGTFELHTEMTKRIGNYYVIRHLGMGKLFILYLGEAYSKPCSESKIKIF